MEKALATAFVQPNARSERVNRYLNSKLASILKVIGNGLGRAVGAIHHTLGQRSPRKATEHPCHGHVTVHTPSLPSLVGETDVITGCLYHLQHLTRFHVLKPLNDS